MIESGTLRFDQGIFLFVPTDSFQTQSPIHRGMVNAVPMGIIGETQLYSLLIENSRQAHVTKGALDFFQTCYIGLKPYEDEDREKVRSLFHSLFFRSIWFRELPTPIICVESELGKLLEDGTDSGWLSGKNAFPVETLLSYNKNLTLEERLIKTLENIDRRVELKPDYRIPGSVHIIDHIDFQVKQYPDYDGVVYGLNGQRAIEILSELQRRNYMEFPDPNKNWGKKEVGFRLTFSGREFLENNSTPGSSEVFLVVSFKQYEGDQVLRDLIRRIEIQTGLTICPVWDERKEHNGYIDEVILERIEQSCASMVVIDPKNFNVGFEAGFAKGRSKGVIFVRPKPTKGSKVLRPFDVQCMNITDYSAATIEEDSKRLAIRLLIAANRKPSVT